MRPSRLHRRQARRLHYHLFSDSRLAQKLLRQPPSRNLNRFLIHGNPSVRLMRRDAEVDREDQIRQGE